VLEPRLQAQDIVVVNTKLDKGTAPASGVSVSALTGDGLDQLLDFVYQFLLQRIGTSESPLLSGRRQFDCLAGAALSVRAAMAEVYAGRLELAAEEVRLASRRLEELTGAIGVEDVLDEVFGRFCLGK
jgi:tRNA modification GTPase